MDESMNSNALRQHTVHEALMRSIKSLLRTLHDDSMPPPQKKTINKQPPPPQKKTRKNK